MSTHPSIDKNIFYTLLSLIRDESIGNLPKLSVEQILHLFNL